MDTDTALQQLQQRIGDVLNGKGIDDSQPITEIARRLVGKAAGAGPEQFAAIDLLFRILAAGQ